MKAFLSLLEGSDLNKQKWLDAGSGGGILSRQLVERGCDVIGVDASAQMIEAAKRLAQSGPFADKLGFRCDRNH